MANKEIIIPEGYCIDEENSTSKCVKFKPKKTYEADDNEHYNHFKSPVITELAVNILGEDTVCFMFPINH